MADDGDLWLKTCTPTSNHELWNKLNLGDFLLRLARPLLIRVARQVLSDTFHSLFTQSVTDWITYTNQLWQKLNHSEGSALVAWLLRPGYETIDIQGYLGAFRIIISLGGV